VLVGMYGLLHDLIAAESDVATIYGKLQQHFAALPSKLHAQVAMKHALQCMEVMLTEGWLKGKVNKKRPMLKLESPTSGTMIHGNDDEAIMAARSQPVSD